jgi:hypothetical protein
VIKRRKRKRRKRKEFEEERGRDGRGMWHVCGREEMRASFWRGKLMKTLLKH